MFLIEKGLSRRVALIERRLASSNITPEARERLKALLAALNERIKRLRDQINEQCEDYAQPPEQPQNPGSVSNRGLIQRGCYSQSPVMFPIPEGTFPKGYAAADFDNDGDTDVIGVSQSGGLATIARNNAQGMFDLSMLFKDGEDPGIGANDHPNNTAAGDLDGDGDLDLVVASNHTISILMNRHSQGGRDFDPAPINLVTGNFGVTSMAVADLNGDGKEDIVFKSYGRRVDGRWVSPVGVLINRSSADQIVFSEAALIGRSLPVNSVRSVISLGNVLGNAAPDIILPVAASSGSDGPAFLAVFENRGDGTFKEPIRVPVGVFLPAQGIAVDLNQDGLNEIVIVDRVSGMVRVLAKRLGSFVALRPIFQSDRNYAASMLISGDVNRDGFPDIVIASDNGWGSPRNNMPVVLYGNGTLELSSPEQVELGDPFDPAARYSSPNHARNISLSDLNGDDAPDTLMLDWFNAVLAAKNQCIG
ncbi:MAG: hypothetical protein DCC75_04470 [Proteobacteria bacterium]|nr:MAG: hypothetical protein DCC75_04470 [Pseudomonadota bacterium]